MGGACFVLRSIAVGVGRRRGSLVTETASSRDLGAVALEGWPLLLAFPNT
jgi:hypothetical protein